MAVPKDSSGYPFLLCHCYILILTNVKFWNKQSANHNATRLIIFFTIPLSTITSHCGHIIAAAGQSR